MNFDIYNGPNGKLCARPKNNISYTHEYFLDRLESIARVPRAMGICVLDYLSKFLVDAMSEGATLTLDKIGTFAATLKVEQDIEETGRKLDGHVVSLNHISFRPNPEMKQKATDKMVNRRVRVNMRNRLNKADIDQRKDILVKLLEKNTIISSTEYMAAAKIGRSQAYRDLAEFEKGGVVVVKRTGNSKHYMLKK